MTTKRTHSIRVQTTRGTTSLAAAFVATKQVVAVFVIAVAIIVLVEKRVRVSFLIIEFKIIFK